MSSPLTPSDRRPIRSRELPVFIAMARGLARAGVSANAISVFGMLACIAAGGLFAATSHAGRWAWVCWLLGAGLVQLRLLCNMLDGMVALERGVASRVGELYNEIPDRVSDMAALIGLGYAAHSDPTLGYLAAALAVLVAYVRAAARAAGAPSDFRGPMAKQQRMFLVSLCGLCMGLAPAAWGGSFPAPEWPVPRLVLVVICAGCVLTTIRRVVRAAGILRDPG